MSVLIVTVLAGRDRVAEAWYLWRLESAEGVDRFRAAKRLGEMRSARAIPGLLELLKTLPAASAAVNDVWGPRTNADEALAGVLGAIGAPAAAPLARALEESRGERKPWRRYACRALGETGAEAAIPPLIAALDDRDTCVRMTAFHVLESLGTGAREAIPAITAHLEDRDGFIRGAAARALNGIQAGLAAVGGAHAP